MNPDIPANTNLAGLVFLNVHSDESRMVSQGWAFFLV
jgi:hypothetical protein